jgi:ubiquitin-protein ligase
VSSKDEEHYVLRWQKDGQAKEITFLRSLFYKGTNSFRVDLACPNHFPKAPPHNTTTTGNKFQHMNLKKHSDHGNI